MSSGFEAEICTFEISNDTFVVSSLDSWKAILVVVTSTSTANATITGTLNKTIGGKPSGSITVIPASEFRFCAGENGYITELSISSPSVACTVKIALTKSPYITMNEMFLTLNT